MQQARFAYGKGALAGFTAVVLAVSLMVPATAFADPTSAEKRAEAEAVLASLNTMQEQLDRASNNYFTALSEQEEAEKSRDAAQERIDEANGQIADLQDRLGSRARSMYRSGSSSMLDLLLGSTSFQAFATNWDLLTQINSEDADLVQQTKDLRAEVEEQEAVFAEQARVAQEKADEAKRIEERAAEEAARAAVAAAADAATNDSSRGSSNGGANSNSDGNNGASEPPYVPSTGNAIVDRAYSQLGKPYAWGAAGPHSYDCSGLVSYALTGSYSHVYTTGSLMGLRQVSNPQPGDICTNDHHCGVYIGGGQMIHAPQTGDVVKVSAVHSDMIYVRP